MSGQDHQRNLSGFKWQLYETYSNSKLWLYKKSASKSWTLDVQCTDKVHLRDSLEKVCGADHVDLNL